MGLKELREIEDGEIIKYDGENTPLFTKNKNYKVKVTSVGRLIVCDVGVGHFLNDYKLYEQFSKSA